MHLEGDLMTPEKRDELAKALEYLASVIREAKEPITAATFTYDMEMDKWQGKTLPTLVGKSIRLDIQIGRKGVDHG